MMSRMFRVLGFVAVVLAVSLLGACASDDRATDPEVAQFETDLAALREIYPLGDLDVESVRWRYHNDFVNDSNATGESRIIDDLPAQGADRIVEAIFVFDDDTIRSAALAGRTTTLADTPSWYPEALATADDLTMVVAVTPIDGLPGTVAAFPDVDGYVLVTFQP